MGGQCANERVRGKGAGVVTINAWEIQGIPRCSRDNARASDGIHLDMGCQWQMAQPLCKKRNPL